MSTIVRAPQLGWRLLPRVVAACAAIVVASVAVAALGDDPAPPPEAGAGRALVDISAVPWTTDVYPVGAAGPLRGIAKNRFDGQRDPIRTVVRNVAEAAVLSDGDIAPWVRALLTRPAAVALRADRTGIPPKASDVEMTMRRARIGMQAPAMRAAAARVRIEMRGSIDGRSVAWRDDLTLWLERSGGSWRVIAFDLDRTQLP
jgi:hypothetical protein